MNRLLYGDCLTVMREHLKAGSVDLIYLDPPFNSERQYNSIYKDETGRPLPEQIDAFNDTWELTVKAEQEVRYMPVLMREKGLDDATVELWKLWLHALRDTRPRLLAYLTYMTLRLLEMRTVLKPTGSIYLHCDPYASHYLKVLMDAIFGHENFGNEIIWHYRRWSGASKHFQRMHDVILRYCASKHAIFNVQYQPYADESYIEDTVRGVVDGKLVRLKDESGNPIKREKPNKGVPMHDTWHDINFLAPTAKERTGYKTQKPRALLERIIKASSNEGDVVLDPFAGCATTLEAAHFLNRQWIGIDIAFHAVNRVIHNRLKDRCGLVEGKDYVVDGVPLTLEAARDLWQRDTYHFQHWAVEQIDGFVTSRRTGDGGIDGRLFFYMPGRSSFDADLESMVIEVKGGKHVTIKVLRELRAVLEGDTALMAGLIVMEPLSAAQERNFNRYMAEVGSLDVHGVAYPRMQILTVEDILDGKRFATPNVAAGRRDPQPRLPSAG